MDTIYIKQKPPKRQKKCKQREPQVLDANKKQNYIIIFLIFGLILFSGLYLGKGLLADIFQSSSLKNTDDQINYIQAKELKDKMEANPDLLLLDVRTAEDYNWEHIEGAANIPLNELSYHYQKFNKKTEVVTVCDNSECEYSYIAARRLNNEGFKNVAVLEGGIPAWEEEGFDIARSEDAVKLEQTLKVRPIDQDTLEQALAEETNIFLLDIRDKEDYLEDHLDGATWIDTEHFEEAIAALPAAARIIIIANNEEDALNYGTILSDEGFLNLRYLEE